MKCVLFPTRRRRRRRRRRRHHRWCVMGLDRRFYLRWPIFLIFWQIRPKVKNSFWNLVYGLQPKRQNLRLRDFVAWMYIWFPRRQIKFVPFCKILTGWRPFNRNWPFWTMGPMIFFAQPRLSFREKKWKTSFFLRGLVSEKKMIFFFFFFFRGRGLASEEIFLCFFVRGLGFHLIHFALAWILISLMRLDSHCVYDLWWPWQVFSREVSCFDNPLSEHPSLSILTPASYWYLVCGCWFEAHSLTELSVQMTVSVAVGGFSMANTQV